MYLRASEFIMAKYLELRPLAWSDDPGCGIFVSRKLSQPVPSLRTSCDRQSREARRLQRLGLAAFDLGYPGRKPYPYTS